MAKLMVGFIQNCKIILSMLKYEINVYEFIGLAKVRARRKRRLNYKKYPEQVK